MLRVRRAVQAFVKAGASQRVLSHWLELMAALLIASSPEFMAELIAITIL